MKAFTRLLHRQDGFSLIEVLVSSSILLVGLTGSMSLIGQADQASMTNSAKEGATNLQRELIEAARSIPYDKLTPNTIGSLVRAQAGLGDSSLGAAGWTVRRRGFTYTVSMGTCAVDDPRDGFGAHDAGVFCATGAGGTPAEQCLSLLRTSGDGLPGEQAPTGVTAGDCGIDSDYDGTVDDLVDPTGTTCNGASCDANPADYKRIVSLVRWDRGGGARYVLQSSTAANPGVASAPAIGTLTAGVANPVLSATSIAFTATATPDPAAVTWYLDGTQKAPAGGAGGSWSFTWPLGTVGSGAVPGNGEVVDGSYQVGVKAFDRYGQPGLMRSVTVVLNRRAPYPPQNVEGGRSGGVVELQWNQNRERDIEGYRAYRLDAGVPVPVCALTTRTSCQDTSPPAGPALDYYVVAVDKDAQGALREGAHSDTVTVRDTNTPPPPPASLSASTSGGNTLLAWAAPAGGDPDSGDSIDHYVIYRDGTAYADRYDRTATAQELTFTDAHTNGIQHTYWVAAVDTQLAESTLVGPVTR
jgi:prepilin-type N-terminal cleavage/methylation domain-containing protein